MKKQSGKSSKNNGITQISISLPKSLVDQIGKMAAAENRNRSNFIANVLEHMAEAFEAKAQR